MLIRSKTLATLVLGVCCIAALNIGALARDDLSEESMAAQACHMVEVRAEERSLGLLSDETKVCNAHRELCLRTKRSIQQHGLTLPVTLTCDGMPYKAERATVAPPQIVGEQAAFLACTQVAQAILSGVPIDDIRERISICNKSPKKQDCLDVKRFIENRGRVAAELTCN